MRIGEVASRSGVSVQALRYYERSGLLGEITRRASGYREYNGATLRRLNFIKGAQELGFTLGDIGELLALRVDERTPCEKVERHAHRVIGRIDRQIVQLRRVKKALSQLAAQCQAPHSQSECPLLDALEVEESN